MTLSKELKIVVTGGAGFIGSHLIDNLLELGHHVTNIDNFDSFYDERIKRKNIEKHFEYKTYKLFETDIRDKIALNKIIKNDTDVIVHLAAKAGVRPSIENPISYQEVNVYGTQNLLEISKQKSIKQFVFASSSSVYGKNLNVPWKEDNSTLLPISPYASTKISCELLGHVYSHLYGIRFLALRFFTVYGPRQRPDLAIHKFTKLMKDDKEISLYGEGSTKRDYTYIGDIINGIMSAIYYESSNYEIINLGNNETIGLLELVENIENALQINSKKQFIEEQPGDVKQTWADIKKAQKLLKYKPKFDLHSGLKEFIKWFNQHSIN